MQNISYSNEKIDQSIECEKHTEIWNGSKNAQRVFVMCTYLLVLFSIKFSNIGFEKQ